MRSGRVSRGLSRAVATPRPHSLFFRIRSVGASLPNPPLRPACSEADRREHPYSRIKSLFLHVACRDNAAADNSTH